MVWAVQVSMVGEMGLLVVCAVPVLGLGTKDLMVFRFASVNEDGDFLLLCDLLTPLP